MSPPYMSNRPPPPSATLPARPSDADLKNEINVALRKLHGNGWVPKLVIRSEREAPFITLQKTTFL